MWFLLLTWLNVNSSEIPRKFWKCQENSWNEIQSQKCWRLFLIRRKLNSFLNEYMQKKISVDFKKKYFPHLAFIGLRFNRKIRLQCSSYFHFYGPPPRFAFSSHTFSFELIWTDKISFFFLFLFLLNKQFCGALKLYRILLLIFCVYILDVSIFILLLNCCVDDNISKKNCGRREVLLKGKSAENCIYLMEEN